MDLHRLDDRSVKRGILNGWRKIKKSSIKNLLTGEKNIILYIKMYTRGDKEISGQRVSGDNFEQLKKSTGNIDNQRVIVECIEEMGIIQWKLNWMGICYYYNNSY